ARGEHDVDGPRLQHIVAGHEPAVRALCQLDRLVGIALDSQVLRAAEISESRKAALPVPDDLLGAVARAAVNDNDLHGVRHLGDDAVQRLDRKSTRLNSSHVSISYAVFCLK